MFVCKTSTPYDESNNDIAHWYQGGDGECPVTATEVEHYVCDPDNRPARSEVRDTRWDCEKTEHQLREEGLCDEREAALLIGRIQTADTEAQWGDYDTCAQVRSCVPEGIPCDDNLPDEFTFEPIVYNYDKVRPPTKFQVHEEADCWLDDTPVPHIDTVQDCGRHAARVQEPNPDKPEFAPELEIYTSDQPKGRVEIPLYEGNCKGDVPLTDW